MGEQNAEKDTSLERTSIPGRSWPGASLYKSLKLGWQWRRLRWAAVAASEAAQGHEANGLPPGSRECQLLYQQKEPMSKTIRRAPIHGLAMVRRERVLRHERGATDAPLRVNDCQFAIEFESVWCRPRSWGPRFFRRESCRPRRRRPDGLRLLPDAARALTCRYTRRMLAPMEVRLHVGVRRSSHDWQERFPLSHR